LCDEAIFLARLLAALRPEEPEIEGCLALLLLTQARAAARIGPDGATVPLAGQDRALWSAPMIAEGRALLDRALARRRPGAFQIKAAIAALHCAEGPPDWLQIAALCARLHDLEPSPVVRLSHAVALAEGQGAATGLPLIEALAADLDGYQPYHAARAEYLARLARPAEARAAYDRAIDLAASPADAAFLARRRAALPPEPAA
jgi:RNA polymerase sigma-70 factor (ECF subfamily)